MTPKPSYRTFFLAPTSSQQGISSVALGLVRAFQREGFDVGFAKPVADPESYPDGLDRSVHFARSLLGLNTPDPIPAERAEEMIRTGNLFTLLEEIVELVEEARGNRSMVVVEGLLPSTTHPLTIDLDIAMGRSLSAEIIPVVPGLDATVKSIVGDLADAQHRFLAEGRPFAGLIVGRARGGDVKAEEFAKALEAAKIGVPVLAVTSDEPALNAPRLVDVAGDLGFGILRPGDIKKARVGEIVIGARSPDKVVKALKPGTLVVTPGDRSDIIITTTLARSSGMPIAGLLLTCDEPMAPSISEFLSPRFGDLPVLTTELQTYDVAVRLNSMDRRVRHEDAERMEKLLEHVADHIDLTPLAPATARSNGGLMTPPMFRHRMIQEARAANRRIVLPEGDEPRTIKAAVICTQKRIARCVLVGDPKAINDVAVSHGIELPPELEILDPAKVRGSYVAPMVELRKSKGLTPPQAEAQLEDNVVLATMMLAMGDVDGLVSGAVHTTASTVRPALQLIKTAPGNSIVSSVFFMLMPDQVLVYGDCAINPDPSADELAEIACQSAESARSFGIDPRVAMISYSTGTSGTGSDVDKVRAATLKVMENRPDLLIDGPIQYDAASVESVGKQKAPGSPVAGHANVFVFPDLNTGNTTYKAVQRSANVVSVGPMLQGLRKPVNDLSRGALVDDIVYTIALTAIQVSQSEQPAQAAAAE
ncbi:phosphate acetyltransferase [Pleomorphomonas sp. JP5]|uniref:phosphate acetyltransferase n=1 Tax=Pleomorphomonas sp. JP5 TaxID=2942998 RepID=UPI002043E7BE|nr:phosphate acetyltransferase [Pleomorphomonas sp. JP5]MCM5558036.1 phosphate acetyltransferase [Pleomorphomonas sp. JP5]